MLESRNISNFVTQSGYRCHLQVTYQLFGQPLGDAPVVLVNHALTGNSEVCGENGWWSDLIGVDKVIDTSFVTILAIDIPGNGYDGHSYNLITNYKEFHCRDIAILQYNIIEYLNIHKIYACIGGSLGGQIAWELATLQPDLIEHLIPVATDWKATDWVIAQCKIQDSILTNSSSPIEDARMHAMTFYRTAASFEEKFKRTRNKELGMYNIESWLLHHGKRLKERFKLSSYKLMNHLLGQADITKERGTVQEVFKTVTSKVHLIAIDSDGLFLANPIRETYDLLKEAGVQVTYQEITSIHGHDAFLIEYNQLAQSIKPIFSKIICHQ